MSDDRRAGPAPVPSGAPSRSPPALPDARNGIINFRPARGESVAKWERLPASPTSEGIQMICADGGNDLPVTLSPVHPDIPVRRCRAHRTGNIPDTLRKPDQEDAKRHLHKVTSRFICHGERGGDSVVFAGMGGWRRGRVPWGCGPGRCPYGGRVLRRTSRKRRSTAFAVRACFRPPDVGYRKRTGRPSPPSARIISRLSPTGPRWCGGRRAGAPIRRRFRRGRVGGR